MYRLLLIGQLYHLLLEYNYHLDKSLCRDRPHRLDQIDRLYYNRLSRIYMTMVMTDPIESCNESIDNCILVVSAAVGVARLFAAISISSKLGKDEARAEQAAVGATFV